MQPPFATQVFIYIYIYRYICIVSVPDHHLYVELKDPKGNDLRTVLQWEGLAKGESDDSSSTNSSSGSSSSKSSSLTNSSSTDSFSSVTTTASSSSSQGHASPVRAFSSTRYYRIIGLLDPPSIGYLLFFIIIAFFFSEVRRKPKNLKQSHQVLHGLS